MTPPLPEPLLPDGELSHTARAALEALFEKLRREKLSLAERTALKGSAIKRSENDLQEALHRAELHRYTSIEQTHRQACSLLNAWRRANPDALKKFASWMSAKRPRFGPSIFKAVDVYLGEGGRES